MRLLLREENTGNSNSTVICGNGNGIPSCTSGTNGGIHSSCTNGSGVNAFSSGNGIINCGTSGNDTSGSGICCRNGHDSRTSINNNDNNSVNINSSAMSSPTVLNNFLLLNPLNPDFKKIYFSMLPKVVSEALDNGTTTIDECKQMLQTFIHNPQLTWDERRIVQNVTNQLENLRLLTRQQCAWGVHQTAAPPLVAVPPSSCPPATTNMMKSRRSMSLVGTDDVFSRMKTFRCDGEDVSPLQKKFFFTEPHSGMKDVPIWLKSLRLHKYAPLFALMTYDDMMQLTEEQLELKGVTVGARRKIVLSIQKLKDRVCLLKQLEKDLNDAVNIRTTLNELKIIITTPIRPRRVDQSEDDDIPLFFTRTLCRACSFLLSSPSIVPIEDECYGMAVHVIDRCLNNEAFLPQQKKRLASLKQDIKRIWTPPMRKLSLQNTNGSSCFVHHHHHNNKDRRFSCDLIGSNHSKFINSTASSAAFFPSTQDYSLFNLYRQNCNQHRNLCRTISAPVSPLNLYHQQQTQYYHRQPGTAASGAIAPTPTTTVEHSLQQQPFPILTNSYSPWSTFYAGLQRSAWSCGFEDSIMSNIVSNITGSAQTNIAGSAGMTCSTNSCALNGSGGSSSSPLSSTNSDFSLEQLCERMTVAAIDC